jgi:hypothetical protein
LPLHCALACSTPMADPSTIAARRKRVAFIRVVLPENCRCEAQQTVD